MFFFGHPDICKRSESESDSSRFFRLSFALERRFLLFFKVFSVSREDDDEDFNCRLKKLESEEEPSFGSETYRALVGGTRDAAQTAWASSAGAGVRDLARCMD